MKSNTFNYSLLAVGVAALMGVSTGAMAETINEAGNSTGAASITNVASATYSVDEVAQLPVESNPVVINITETGSFSLTAEIDDSALGNSVQGDDENTLLPVIPNGTVQFQHKLTNLGNLTDTYTMSLTNQTNGTDDDKDFVLAQSPVTVTIHEVGGGTRVLSNITNGAQLDTAEIILAEDEYAVIDINAKTNGNIGGNTQDLTLTATSTYLTGKGVNATATNTNESITKLPVFKIVKSVADTLNLNEPTDTATYTITVTNDDTGGYAADATDVKIVDSLPVGLKLVASSITSTVGSGSTNGTTIGNQPVPSSKGTNSVIDSFEISGITLPVGGIITITFQVQKDADETLVTPTINHARVEAPIGDGITIIDSTDSNDSDQNTNTYYPTDGDSENETGNPTGTGGDSTQPLTANKRGLKLSGPTTREVPNTTTPATQAKHETIITNTGEETEGDKEEEVKFKIVDNGGSSAVSLATPVTISYNPTGVEGDLTTEYTFPTVPTDNIYDLSKAVAVNGGTAFAGMAPKSKVTIKYEVASKDAPSASNATGAPAAATETTTVTLIRGGIDAPTTGPTEVVDTTNVKGLDLVKTQALDAKCDGNADTLFGQGNINDAEPGQCVIYQINATNNFTSFDITDLLISDKLSNFSANATVFEKTSGVYGSIEAGSNSTIDDDTVKKDSSYRSANGEEAIHATVDTLKAGEAATLQFTIKINETRTVTP